MIKHKARLTRLICFVMIFSLTFLFPVIAEATVTVGVSASATLSNTGDTADVSINITDNPGIISFRIRITYGSGLTLTGTTDAGLLNEWTQPAPTLSSPYVLRWADALALINNTATGKVATMHFNFDSNATEAERSIKIEVIEIRQFDGTRLTGNEVNLTVNSTPTPPDPITSVDVTWGAMEFTYTGETWDYNNRKYVGGGWNVNETNGNRITVENVGNVDVSVSYSYGKTVPAISGSFSDGTNPITSSAMLSVGETKNAWLLLVGKPTENLSNATLGTVTVSLGGS